jgi:DNA polymerase III subunit gamma/tau
MSDRPSPEGLFGEESPGRAGYLVLARKYRPHRFEDLVGQEAMVRTIANSFDMGRVPHAYMLTGVRGVGKTTTARLLARALNYSTPDCDRPSIHLNSPGVHCQAIQESRHPDVLEMDAASRTGINDIREILEGVRYAPLSARYKVYIIDEVHMLSNAAFNGLLKTLEEPPPHVKFIMATTEIRKVPVTVLSRCQRFDLKRIAPPVLTAHLRAICEREHVGIAQDGLELIARAADGSVRDALSLLDQALVQSDGEGAIIAAQAVRIMLGLADRGRVLDIYGHVAGADAASAVLELRAQYDVGTDPAQILRDLLEIGHEIAMAQALGPNAHIVGGADWEARIRHLASRISPAQAARIWQLLLRALDEAGRAPDPLAAVEMALVRLCAAMGLPSPEEAAKMLQALPPAPDADAPQSAAASSSPAGGPSAGPISFQDILNLLAERRDIELEIAAERCVRVAQLRPGLLHFAPTKDAPDALAARLAKALREATGEAWEVRGDAASEKETWAEAKARAQAARMQAIKAHPFVAAALLAFPDSQVSEVKAIDPPVDSGARGAEILPLRGRAAQSGSLAAPQAGSKPMPKPWQGEPR